MLALVLWGCAAEPVPPGGAPVPSFEPSNVLIVLADDMGIDAVAAYEAHPGAAITPVMDQLGGPRCGQPDHARRDHDQEHDHRGHGARQWEAGAREATRDLTSGVRA